MLHARGVTPRLFRCPQLLIVPHAVHDQDQGGRPTNLWSLESRGGDGDESSDGGPWFERAGGGERVEAVGRQLVRTDVRPDRSALGALGDQVTKELLEFTSGAGKARVSVQQRGQVGAVVLAPDLVANEGRRRVPP